VLFFLLNSSAHGVEWKDLWKNKNQQAMQMLDENPAAAAELFEDKQWQGVGDFRANNFQQAAKQFETNSSFSSKYNYATALAKTGDLKTSLEVYNKLLSEEQGLTDQLREDAQFNRDLVNKALENIQQQNKKQDKKSDKSSDDEKKSSEGEEQKSKQQGKPSDTKDNQQSGEQTSDESEVEKSPPNESEKQTAEEQQMAESEKQNQPPESKQEANLEQQSLNEEQQATEQWLRQIPDDPSGLLRRKLLQSHRTRYPQVNNGVQAW
jgi:Ca-activated chloride channel family protein